MPDELEERLERALRGAPPADAGAQERARRAALAAMPPPRAGRLPRRGLLAAAAVCAAVLVFAGATLAANGVHIPLVGAARPDHRPRPPAQPRHRALALPRGAIAFAAVAGGRAWLATSAGRGLHGRPLDLLAVSPDAINLLEGAGPSLRAVAAGDGHVAFTRTVPGTSVAAAWAPAGIRIAYTVRTRRGNRVYDMYGNGRHAFLVARRSSGAAPSWRWDSEAFAYVGGDGRTVVHDVIDGSSTRVGGCGIRRAAAVAFAPYGGALALADRSGRVAVVQTLTPGRGMCAAGTAAGLPRLAWLRTGQLVVAAGHALTRYAAASGGADVTTVPGQVAGIAAAPGGRRLALALRGRDGDVRVVEARTPRFSEAAAPLRVTRTLIDLGHVRGAVALSWQ
jgi:hypothetical protein